MKVKIVLESKSHIRYREKRLLILRGDAVSAGVVALAENVFVVGQVLKIERYLERAPGVLLAVGQSQVGAEIIFVLQRIGLIIDRNAAKVIINASAQS